MPDYDAMRLGPIYSTLGAAVTVTLNDSDMTEVSLTVIDKTSGVPVQLGDMEAHTVRPAAAVRMTQLTASGLTPASLDDATLSLDGTTWRVRGHMLRPGIGGESKGEVYLLLADDAV
jgi:hypothetical protein